MSGGARVALRYDRSPAIGLGHARRAGALDAAFAARGVEVLHAVPAAARDALVADGIARERAIGVDHDGVRALMASAGVTHVVLDTLWSGNAAGTAHEVAVLRRGGAATVVIDSMPPDHYPDGAPGEGPDLLVTPYLGASRTASRADAWLGGERYAILGPEFAEVRAPSAPRVPRRALLSCGGSDEDGLTACAARALLEGGLAVDAAIGPLFAERSRAALHELADRVPGLRLHDAPSSLAPLIAHADVVVGRPGLLRYEAAALGRFGIYLARGDGYRGYYAGFVAAGLAEIRFEPDPGDRERFLERLRTLGTGVPAIANRIDVDGANRVADAILTTRANPHRCR